MSTHPEANRLNLEYYRKAAKSLQQAARSGDPAALQRITRHFSEPLPAPALHQAQLAVAREQGFASWPRFRKFLLESALDFQGLVAEFVDTALDDARRAQEMLDRHPALADAGFYTALLLGGRTRVERALAERPSLATAKGGPRDWPPLLYVCFSRFASPQSTRAGDLLETARLLLRRGADPNGCYVDARYPDSPLSCLYAATGLNNHPELARALLDAGARPDDGESLYHSTEHPDLACLRLLLERGASPRSGNVLKHMLDHEHPEGLRLLLAAGANPNETNPRGATALHWAVWRGRSAAIVAQLLDAGAAIDARRQDGRTAYMLAAQSGQTATTALLASRGADTAMSALDRFLGDCAAAGPADLERLLANAPPGPLPPEYHRFLPEFAASHRTSAVRVLLGLGVPVDTPGDLDGTALHWACWKGYADLVQLLLENGASLAVEDSAFHGTPAGWYAHGLEHSLERDGDYPEVARLLRAAGATGEGLL